MWNTRRVLNAIRFWWQRRTRGWDDSDLWNLDIALAKLILPRLVAFERTTHGYPGSYETPEAWHADLKKMIRAFELIATENSCMWLEGSPEIDEGIALFAKHFQALWD